MLIVETIAKVRLAYFRDGKSIRETARKFNLARNTVKSIIRSGITDQKYQRSEQPRPKLGAFVEQLAEWLKEDSIKPVRHRRSAQILFEQLQREGYDGGYDTLRRYVGTWQKEDGTALVKAFVPLEFDPGEAFQFDWSYEKIELGGVPVEVKIAHFRLCHSRKLFCAAYSSVNSKTEAMPLVSPPSLFTGNDELKPLQRPPPSDGTVRGKTPQYNRPVSGRNRLSCQAAIRITP